MHRLVEDIAKVCPEKIEHIGFIIHPSFGKQVEDDLKKVAQAVGAVGKIYYQEEAKGISHAVLFAKELLKGKVIVAFADTLFRAEFKLDMTKDGVIWVQRVSDPAAFGVVKLNASGEIVELVEKPSTFVSDLAIIGIYFFRSGEALAKEMQYLIDNDIKEKGEYQFTSALVRMQQAGARFVPGEVMEWLDCGNKEVMVQTNKRYLDFIKDQQLVSPKARITNSILIPPCFVGEQAVIENSVIGPHVSVGEHTTIRDSRITNSIIQRHSVISDARLDNAVLGNFVNFEGHPADLSLGDYGTVS